MQVRQVLQGDGPLLRAAGLSGCPGTLVLEKDGTAIGAALREGEWIKAVYIAPEWRGRGYGTFLLRRVCAGGPRGLWARAEGAAAQAFLKRCGFAGGGPVLCRGVRAGADNAVACAHAFLREFIRPGGFAVDATAGNGHDTVFLCRAVGPQGRVLAMDIQQQAVDATNARLQSVGLAHIGHAVRADHAGLADILKKEGRPCAVMFNLGYLPGGSHALFTTPRSSLPAMDASLAALVRGGALTVCAYSGGLQGTTERDAVLSWARVLAPQAYRVDIRLFEHEAGNPPVAVCIEKKCAPRPPHSS